MFDKHSKDYSQISLNDFSDDDSDDENVSDNHRSRPNGRNGGSDPVLRQQELMARQDEGLEMLGQSAERLGKMSMMISDEIMQQNKILDEMDETLEDTQQNLDLVTRKTKEFIEQAGGTKNCLIIAVLSLVVFILIVLILYT